MNLRGRLTKLEQALAPPPALGPLVIVCRHVSHFADGRAAGVYHDDPFGGGPHLVFDGAEPDAATLATLTPPRGPKPLFITIGAAPSISSGV